MRAKNGFVLAGVLAGVLTVAAGAARAQTPLSTAFTYQGQLASTGTPATGAFDIRFRLYDAASGGNQVGSTLCSDNLAVTDGLFAASLDFGAAAFAGQKRWLEIEVRPDAGLGCGDATGYTLLSPRQELTATPNALFAQTAATATTATNATNLNGQPPSFFTNAANLTGTLADGQLSSNVARLNGNQTFTGLLNFTNAGNTFFGNGAGLTSLNGANINASTVARSSLSTDVQSGLGSPALDMSVAGVIGTGLNPYSVAISGSYAYVVNVTSNTLQVFNISNPAAPVLAATVPAGSQPLSVAVSGSYAYVLPVSSNVMQVFNISNPAAPTLVASAATGLNPSSVALSGSFAYVVTSSAPYTLQVFNISNPAAPTLTGSTATGTQPFSVAVSGSFVYVANLSSNTLQVFNVSNPAAPTLVGTATTGTRPIAVAVSGSFAYVANQTSNTLQVFNVSNPAAPLLAGSIATGNTPTSVAVSGSFAYVTNGNSTSLQAFNIGNPAAPTLAGTVGTGGGPYAVAVSGSVVCVVNYNSSTLQVINAPLRIGFSTPLASSALSGVNGSGLTSLNATNITAGTVSQTVLPASSWANASLTASAFSPTTFTAIPGTSQTLAMRQGVAVVSWSTSAFTNLASTGYSLRIRAVTNGVTTTGPTTNFFFNQANVHTSISGNALVAIPAAGNTTFTLDVQRSSGTGTYSTDTTDSFSATITNLGQ